jgi:hypothetical protein
MLAGYQEIQLLNFSHLVPILGLLAKLGKRLLAWSYLSVHPSEYNNWASTSFSGYLVFDFLKHVSKCLD